MSMDLLGPFSSKVQAEYQPQLVQLLIRTFAGVVLVLIVRIKLQVLAHRKEAAGIDCGVAPFAVLAFVEELGAGVQRGMVGADSKRLFDLKAVAITPREVSALPVKVGTVPVGEQKSSSWESERSRPAPCGW